MTLALDHVFVCVAAGAEAEASALASAGLVEGAPNVHPGQGTAVLLKFPHAGSPAA